MCLYICTHNTDIYYFSVISLKKYKQTKMHFTLNPEPQFVFIASVLFLLIINKSFFKRKQQIQVNTYFVFTYFVYKSGDSHSHLASLDALSKMGIVLDPHMHILQSHNKLVLTCELILSTRKSQSQNTFLTEQKCIPVQKLIFSLILFIFKARINYSNTLQTPHN